VGRGVVRVAGESTVSIRVMSLVWDNSRAEGSQLLLLLALADFGNDQGSQIWPSIETLARKCRRSTRSVQRDIADLEALGELAVDRKTGRGRTNSYTVLVDNLHRKGVNLSPYGEERVTDRAEKVTDRVVKGDIAVSRESLEPLDRTAGRMLEVVDKSEALARIGQIKLAAFKNGDK
jgi:hypothetical protein